MNCSHGRTNQTIRFSIVVVGAALAAQSSGVSAQSLDVAVANQLNTRGGIACSTLRGADPLTALRDGLLTICARGTGVGATTPSTSAGADSAALAAFPDEVSNRLRKVRKDDDDPNGDPRDAGEARWTNGAWSVFLSGEYDHLNRDVSTFEPGYTSHTSGITFGTDVRIRQRTTLGVALLASDQRGDFSGGGDFAMKSRGMLFYGSYLPTDQSFLQAYGGYSSRSNTRNRSTRYISDDVTVFTRAGSPTSDFSASQLTAGLAAGYDHPIGRFTVGPRLGVDWVRTRTGTYSEQGASGLELTFYDDRVTSLQSSLGVQGSAAYSTGFGVLTPQVTLAWKHEWQNDQRLMDVSFAHDTRAKRFSFQSEPPDRNFADLSLGIVCILPRGLQLFANYRTLLDYGFYNGYSVNVGLRKKL